MKKIALTLCTFFSTFLLAGCRGGIKDGPIAAGDNVFITYTATYPDTQKLYKEQAEPLKMRVGKEEILPMLDEKLLGAKAGDEVTFVVPPHQAFGGMYDPKNVKTMPALYLNQ